LISRLWKVTSQALRLQQLRKSQEDLVEAENQTSVKEVQVEARANVVAVKAAKEELMDETEVTVEMMDRVADSVNLVEAVANAQEDQAVNVLVVAELREETQVVKDQEETLAAHVQAVGLQEVILAASAAEIQDRIKEIEIRAKPLIK
tara:strand:+ start:165 stop:608 length:444 start_codon:yes stop_codon:yes gene_type:complete